MVAYLEQDELIVGKRYDCETYDGETCILEYTGDGMFDGYMPIEGEVRYAFREAGDPIISLEELKPYYDLIMEEADSHDDTVWSDAIPAMLKVMDAAIKWRDGGYTDKQLRAVLELFTN